MIYILTGDIRTGKTSALLGWIAKRNDVDGLLCPDDEHGKRYFLKIKSKEMFPFEIKSETKNKSETIVTIGSFKFLQSAFLEANEYLLYSNKDKNSSYLIIDELGKLELKNQGLHTSAKMLIPQFFTNESSHLILVVRTSLIESVVRHYTISGYQLLEKEDLKLLY